MKPIQKYIIGLCSMMCLMMMFLFPLAVVLADESEVKFEIMPQVDPARLQEINKAVLNANGPIRDTLNTQAATLSTQEQVVTGIMTRDTIINYGISVLRFLSQGGLLIGGGVFVYKGWKYIMAVISGDSPPSGELIMNALKGIGVIIFAIAILRFLNGAFLS